MTSLNTAPLIRAWWNEDNVAEIDGEKCDARAACDSLAARRQMGLPEPSKEERLELEMLDAIYADHVATIQGLRQTYLDISLDVQRRIRLNEQLERQNRRIEGALRAGAGPEELLATLATHSHGIPPDTRSIPAPPFGPAGPETAALAPTAGVPMPVSLTPAHSATVADVVDLLVQITRAGNPLGRDVISL